jgi:hypothetical protein
MKARRGSAIIFSVMMGLIFLIICRAVMNLSLGLGMSRARAAKSATVKAELDGAAAEVWACLDERGYPPAASCQPNPAQQLCLPANIDFAFSGTSPACKMKITADR